jgi:hypothetical protein
LRKGGAPVARNSKWRACWYRLASLLPSLVQKTRGFLPDTNSHSSPRINSQRYSSGALVIRAYEVFSQSKSAVFYDTAGGLILTILGARLVSQASVAADGRAVYIGSNSSHKVKLANCVLIASSAAAE